MKILRVQESEASPTPWETWKLDKTFFTDLSLYTSRHPETRLDRVMDKVRDGLETHRALFDAVPDNPFPARGMIIALAHLVKLGITVIRAKATAAEFASQVVEWIVDVQSAFESSGGHFTWTTWKNLAKMRSSPVNSSKKFAHGQLRDWQNDKRWSRIGNGMIIAKEISEFNDRIMAAKRLFADLSIINISRGIDTILGVMKQLLLRQDSITKEILKIQAKQREQFASILDAMEAQKQSEARRLFLSQILSPHVVVNPTYDQQGKQPCDENTRTEILTDIFSWIDDISSKSQNFLWLTGDPGCGKSAVTASVARHCKDRGILWSQFFINRNNVETTNPNSYFPSIARQFVDHSVDVEHVIHNTLREKPSLMDRISPDQASALFISAVATASKLNPDHPVVVIIDGLDESDRGRLKDTATIFSHLFKGLSRYPNAKVFISSRTEDDIRNPFARHTNHAYVKHVHLDTASPSSLRDVTLFLRKRVTQIVEDNDLNWAEWPGEERMKLLALRASGLFIWAVTVTKFLQEQIDALGTECLNDVLDMLNAEALGDINALYGLILRQTYRGRTNKWEFEKFRTIVGAIVVLREPLCLQDLAALLDLRKTASSSPADVLNFVRRLRTVLVAGAEAIDNETIPRLHKSFFEFITSEEVDQQYRVVIDAADRDLAVQCLGSLATYAGHGLSAQASSNTLPRIVCYAIRFWPSHLNSTNSAVIIDSPSLTWTKLHSLLRHAPHDDHTESLNISISQDRSRAVTHHEDQARTWELTDGTEVSTTTILEGHSDAVLSVAFSPDGRRVVSGSLDSTIILWGLESKKAEATLRGHTKAVRCVKFSPCGDRIASSSDDWTVVIWDVHTHQRLAVLKGHLAPVRSIAFSPCGTHLVSGSDDNLVRHWQLMGVDTSSFGSKLSSHAQPVTTVVYSPDGQHIVSGSGGNILLFWDTVKQRPQRITAPTLPEGVFVQLSPTGNYLAQVRGSQADQVQVWEPQGSTLHEISYTGNSHNSPRGRIWSMAFSPSEQRLVIGCEDEDIYIIELRSGVCSVPPLVGHGGWVMSLAVSPDGRRIASGSRDHTVRIWDMPNEPGVNGDDPATPFSAFSQDSTLVLTSSADRTLRLWNSTTTSSRILPFRGKVRNAAHVTFSPDGSRVAAVSSETAIYLWDTRTCKLVASSGTDFISQVNSILFTKDSQRLVATYFNAPPYIWEENGGKLICVTTPLSENIPANTQYFQVEEPCLNLRGAQWFLNGSPDSTGVWAFLREHIIRGREDGSVTILPVRL
ncbi:hypothetical protein DXG01_003760 [Tephrocybe rancida]|nr:hypothetical protein DXG01_003760 [Tephrocybe rancida]